MKYSLAIRTICEYIDTEVSENDKELRDSLLLTIGILILKDHKTQKVKEGRK